MKDTALKVSQDGAYRRVSLWTLNPERLSPTCHVIPQKRR